MWFGMKRRRREGNRSALKMGVSAHLYEPDVGLSEDLLELGKGFTVGGDLEGPGPEAGGAYAVVPSHLDHDGGAAGVGSVTSKASS